MTYNPVTNKHDVDWTPGRAALFGYWEQTMGPVEKPVKAPTPRLQPSERFAAIAYRLAAWGDLEVPLDDPEAGEVLRHIVEDARTAIRAHRDTSWAVAS